MAAGPDFLCVGLQKAGTQWLFDQLQLHPGFWMPPVKELHYFDRPYRVVSDRIEPYLADPEAANAARRRQDFRPLDERDVRFFRRYETLEQDWGDVERYAALFEPKGALLSGDVTPAYCVLAEATIAAIAERYPSLRVVVMLRDPVERAASQMWSLVCRRKAPRAIVETASDLSAFLREDLMDSR
ncbi:MAG: sulfotransferase, partial [Hansschlegelia sp.]